ncbi:hypothetical protein D3C87_1371390 [compost metagenome]
MLVGAAAAKQQDAARRRYARGEVFAPHGVWHDVVVFPHLGRPLARVSARRLARQLGAAAPGPVFPPFVFLGVGAQVGAGDLHLCVYQTQVLGDDEHVGLVARPAATRHGEHGALEVRLDDGAADGGFGPLGAEYGALHGGAAEVETARESGRAAALVTVPALPKQGLMYTNFMKWQIYCCVPVPRQSVRPDPMPSLPVPLHEEQSTFSSAGFWPEMARYAATTALALAAHASESRPAQCSVQ